MILLDMFQLEPMYAVYGSAILIAAIAFAWYMQKKDEQSRQKQIRIRRDRRREKRRNTRHEK